MASSAHGMLIDERTVAATLWLGGEVSRLIAARPCMDNAVGPIRKAIRNMRLVLFTSDNRGLPGRLTTTNGHRWARGSRRERVFRRKKGAWELFVHGSFAAQLLEKVQ